MKNNRIQSAKLYQPLLADLIRKKRTKNNNPVAKTQTKKADIINNQL